MSFITEPGLLRHLPDNTLKIKMATTERKDSMTDNPTYDQASPAHIPQPQQLEHSKSDSTVNNTYVEPQIDIAPNPVYGMDASFSKPHRSTIRHVQCPIYGDSPVENTNGNVYSSPNQLPIQSTSDGREQPGYSYAMVEASVNGTNKSAQQKNGSSQFSESLVQGHEYAMVDKSTNMQSVAVKYNKLKHEPSAADLSQHQSANRLVENEDLGYSALT